MKKLTKLMNFKGYILHGWKLELTLIKRWFNILMNIFSSVRFQDLD